jgi:AraC family transcriptional regulator of adaptative response / DNA-3-methyladenine glycosylase II
VAAARTAAVRLAAEHGDPLDLEGDHQVTRLFPTSATLAKLDPETLPMPRARGRALVGLAAAIERGDVRLDRSADRAETREAMLALPGIGPWTADYVAMRALGDPDAFLPTDLGARAAANSLGIEELPSRSETWRPWRSYALMRLWSVVLADLAPPQMRTTDEHTAPREES